MGSTTRNENFKGRNDLFKRIMYYIIYVRDLLHFSILPAQRVIIFWLIKKLINQAVLYNRVGSEK